MKTLLTEVRARVDDDFPEVPAALYVRIALGDGNVTGHGQYAMTPAQLVRFREALLDDARSAETSARPARSRWRGLARRAESLKRVPRGIDPEHPRADLLRKLFACSQGFITDEFTCATCLVALGTGDSLPMLCANRRNWSQLRIRQGVPFPAASCFSFSLGSFCSSGSAE